MVKLYVETQSCCQHREQVIYLPDYVPQRPRNTRCENSIVISTEGLN